MNYFMVFDFETDSVKPESCNPVQVASIAVDPYNLKIVEGSEFCSDIRPPNIDDPDYLKNPDVYRTVKWHSGPEVQNCTIEEVVERWKTAPPEKEVWKNFTQHIKKYNPKGTQKQAPVPCGMNIRNFDLPIAARLNDKYNIKKLFNYEVVDLRDLFFYSLVWDSNVGSRSMDNMRKYFGQAATNSHDALQDVKDEAEFVIRYLSFWKNVFERGNNPYKGCMKK